MRYRTKLLLTFSAAAVLTNGISIGVMYQLSRHYLFDEYRAKVESIAATIGSLLDGDLHKTVRGRADESSAAHEKLEQQLRRARDANRRDDTYVKYIFTLFRAPQDPTVLLTGVDPEESLENSAHAGDVYHSSASKTLAIDRLQVDSEFSTDQWGKFLSATAPIRDSAGSVVAAVRTEFSAERVHQKLQPLLYSGLGVLLLGLSISAAAALLLSSRASKPLEALHRSVDEIGRGNLDARVNLDSNDEFGEVARAVNAMAAGLKERETVKSAFARYVSRQVLDGILASGALPEVEGDRRSITVLFADIRGFSTLAEHMRPEAVVELLNEYFEAMVEVVFRNQGTLDKFIGDGLMVVFGAPQEDPYQQEHAVKAAVEMQQELRALCARWEAKGRAPIRIGIGISSGAAIVGNVGSSQRMEYTAIGDTVNLASRLESATKDLDVEILISESTYSAVRGAFQTRSMGPIQVRGRAEPVQAYAVEG